MSPIRPPAPIARPAAVRPAPKPAPLIPRPISPPPEGLVPRVDSLLRTLDDVRAWIGEDPNARAAGNAGVREELRRWLLAKADPAMRNTRVAIVCGAIGSGKTAAVELAIEAAKQRGIWMSAPLIGRRERDAALSRGHGANVMLEPITEAVRNADASGDSRCWFPPGGGPPRIVRASFALDDAGGLSAARWTILRDQMRLHPRVRFVLICDDTDLAAVSRACGGGVKRFALTTPTEGQVAELLERAADRLPSDVASRARAFGLTKMAAASAGDLRAALLSLLGGANLPPAAVDRTLTIYRALPHMMEHRDFAEVDRAYRVWPERMPGMLQRNVGAAIARRRTDGSVAAKLRAMQDMSRFCDALSDAAHYQEDMPWIGAHDRTCPALEELEAMVVAGRPAFAADLRSRLPDPVFNTPEASFLSRWRIGEGMRADARPHAPEDWGVVLKLRAALGEARDPEDPFPDAAIANVVRFRDKSYIG